MIGKRLLVAASMAALVSTNAVAQDLISNLPREGDLTFKINNVPYLKAPAVHDPDANALTLFLLNRHLSEEMSVDVDARGFAGLTVEQADEPRDDDLNAVNKIKQPERIRPTKLDHVGVDGGRLTLRLSPAS